MHYSKYRKENDKRAFLYNKKTHKKESQI